MKRPYITPGDYLLRIKKTRFQRDGTIKIVAEIVGKDNKLGGPFDGSRVRLQLRSEEVEVEETELEKEGEQEENEG